MRSNYISRGGGQIKDQRTQFIKMMIWLQSSRNVSMEGYVKIQGQAIFRWSVRMDHSWDPYISDILNKLFCSIFYKY